MPTSRPPSEQSGRTTRSDRDTSDTAQPLPDRYPARPWIQDGIDYGPAIVAIDDLATWAFDVAEQDVDGWPEGLRRVHTARRFVLARIRGRRARRVPFEDVVFTAGLLARIFESDMRLGMTEVIAILDALHLPTEIVPMSPRPAPNAGAMRPAPRAPVSTLRTSCPRASAFVVPDPDGGCDDCGEVYPFVWPGLRNAA